MKGKNYKSAFLIICSILVFTVLGCDDGYFLLYRNWREVFPPSFIPEPGKYQNYIHVEITSKTANSIIYFTLTGSDPTRNDSIYTSPILINDSTAPTTIKAFAAREGLEDSDIVQGKYTIFRPQGPPEQVAAPVFNPPEGSYTGNITIEIACETPEATIYYSYDQAIPVDRWTIYEDPITLSTDDTITVTLYAFASLLDNPDYTNSETVQATYTLEKGVCPVEFSLLSETYTEAQTLSLSSDTENATIYYHLSGGDPIIEGSIYNNAITLDNPNAPVSETLYNINAVAYDADLGYSVQSELEVTITGQVAPPKFAENQRILSSPQTIPITTQTENATIYYTLDGSTPSTNDPSGDSLELRGQLVFAKAIATREGWKDSELDSQWYEVPEILDNGSDEDILEPAIAYAPFGNYCVCWQQNNGTYNRIYFAILDSNSNVLIREELFGTPPLDTQNLSEVSIDYHPTGVNSGAFGIIAIYNNPMSDDNVYFTAIDAQTGNSIETLPLFSAGTEPTNVTACEITGADFTSYSFAVFVESDNGGGQHYLTMFHLPLDYINPVDYSVHNGFGYNYIHAVYNNNKNCYGVVFGDYSNNRNKLFIISNTGTINDTIVLESDDFFPSITYRDYDDGSILEAFGLFWVNNIAPRILYHNQYSLDQSSFLLTSETSVFTSNHQISFNELVYTSHDDQVLGDFGTAYVLFNPSPPLPIYHSLIRADGSLDSTYHEIIIHESSYVMPMVDMVWGNNEYGIVFNDDFDGDYGGAKLAFVRMPFLKAE